MKSMLLRTNAAEPFIKGVAITVTDKDFLSDATRPNASEAVMLFSFHGVCSLPCSPQYSPVVRHDASEEDCLLHSEV